MQHPRLAWYIQTVQEEGGIGVHLLLLGHTGVLICDVGLGEVGGGGDEVVAVAGVEKIPLPHVAPVLAGGALEDRPNGRC